MDGHTVHGDKIRAIREKKLMSLRDLATKSGVSYSYLKYIEGDGRQPTGVIAHKIAKGLTCKITDFTTPAPGPKLAATG